MIVAKLQRLERTVAASRTRKIKEDQLRYDPYRVSSTLGRFREHLDVAAHRTSTVFVR
jgi:hypothetical protein